MKSKLSQNVFTLLSVILLSSCGSSNPGGKTSSDKQKPMDENATVVSVYNWDGGYGTDWLRNAIARFKETVKDKSYENGKKGADFDVTPDKRNTAVSSVTSFDSSDYELYFTEKVDYNLFTKAQGGNRLLDLTDILTTNNSYEPDKKIIDKFTEDSKEFIGIEEADKTTHYYAIPHYIGMYGIVYNADIFESKHFYYDDSNQIQAMSRKTTKGVGPDGVKGTYDDGLPRTYEEFFNLCSYIASQNMFPMHWTGQYADQYLSGLFRSLVTNHDGAQLTKAKSTFTGNYKVVSLNADLTPKVTKNGNHATSIETEDSALEDKAGSRHDVYRTEGNYYAAEFISRLVRSDYGTSSYFSSDAWKSDYSHIQAQQDFVRSGTDFHVQNSYAMLVDGPWWEGEASETFGKMAKRDEKYAKGNRNFAWMPLPWAKESQIGNKPTLYDDINSYCFAKANIPDSHKEVIKDFLKFVSTDAELNEFTKLTGVKKNLNYTVLDSTMAKMTPYEKSLASYLEDATIVNPNSKNQYYLSHVNDYDDVRYYLADFGTSSYNPASAFYARNNNEYLVPTPESWFASYYKAKQQL